MSKKWYGLFLALAAAHCSSSSSGESTGGTGSSGGTASGSTGSALDGSMSNDGSMSTDDGSTGTGADASSSCEAAAPDDAGTTQYDPDDPNIQYIGRVDFSNPKKPKYAEAAVYVSAKFRGDAASVRFQDENRGGSYDFFDVVIDDMAPIKITPEPVKYTYDLPVHLCYGDHKITFIKRTEADFGSTQFLGFKFAQILPPDPRPSRQIEIIGDSITCGAGVEVNDRNAPECMQNGLLDSSGQPLSGYGQGVENADEAYGPVLARQLDADWHVTCAGGIGLVRNYYSRTDQRPMPEIYDLMYPEDTANTTKWDPAAHPEWKPNAIVIGLGTNDFSRDESPSGASGPLRDPMSQDTLKNGYISFIDKLKGYYPGVHVYLVNSPLLGNGYPTSSDMQLADHEAVIQQVVDYYAADGGDPNVHVVKAFVPKAVATGCGGHPNVQDQTDAANAIAKVIKDDLGW